MSGPPGQSQLQWRHRSLHHCKLAHKPNVVKRVQPLPTHHFCKPICYKARALLAMILDSTYDSLVGVCFASQSPTSLQAFQCCFVCWVSYMHLRDTDRDTVTHCQCPCQRQHQQEQCLLLYPVGLSASAPVDKAGWSACVEQPAAAICCAQNARHVSIWTCTAHFHPSVCMRTCCHMAHGLVMLSHTVMMLPYITISLITSAVTTPNHV